MLEIAWNAKKTWNFEEILFQILFFSIFSKFIKNSSNIPSISKTIQHTPMTWCTYLQRFSRKYINAFLSYSAKTKCDGRTDRWTDGRTDRQTGGRCNICRPGPSAPWEIIKKSYQGWILRLEFVTIIWESPQIGLSLFTFLDNQCRAYTNHLIKEHLIQLFGVHSVLF